MERVIAVAVFMSIGFIGVAQTLVYEDQFFETIDTGYLDVVDGASVYTLIRQPLTSEPGELVWIDREEHYLRTYVTVGAADGQLLQRVVIPLTDTQYVSILYPNISANWTMQFDSTREINGITLRYATTSVDGSKWHCWLDVESPVAARLWRLPRAPGLIYEANREDGVHSMRLIRIVGEADAVRAKLSAKLAESSQHVTRDEYRRMSVESLRQDVLTAAAEVFEETNGDVSFSYSGTHSDREVSIPVEEYDY